MNSVFYTSRPRLNAPKPRILMVVSYEFSEGHDLAGHVVDSRRRVPAEVADESPGAAGSQSQQDDSANDTKDGLAAEANGEGQRGDDERKGDGAEGVPTAEDVKGAPPAEKEGELEADLAYGELLPGGVSKALRRLRLSVWGGSPTAPGSVTDDGSFFFRVRMSLRSEICFAASSIRSARSYFVPVLLNSFLDSSALSSICSSI